MFVYLNLVTIVMRWHSIRVEKVPHTHPYICIYIFIMPSASVKVKTRKIPLSKENICFTNKQ